MVLAPGTAGRISDLGFTVANHTTSAASGVFSVQYSCYDTERTLLFRRSIQFLVDPSFPILPGTVASIHFGSGLLLSTGDVVPERCSFSTLLTSHDFPLVANLDEYYSGPLVTGSSSRFYHDFTTGQDVAIPEGSNLAMFVATQPAPTPGPLAALLASIPFVTRRRR